MKRILMAALIALLTGCSGAGNLLQSDPTADQFYTLDTQKLLLCRGLTHDCQLLTPLASAQEYAPPIEKAYGAKLEGPNYPLSLIKLMLSPPNNSYKASLLGESASLYRLPINAQTNSVWNALHQAYGSTYLK